MQGGQSFRSCHGNNPMAVGKSMTASQVTAQTTVLWSVAETTVMRSPRTMMLRASETLQRQNDTRRLNPMSMHADNGICTIFVSARESLP
jgi:hypothetical protein